MEPVASISFRFTKDQVNALRRLLASNGNRIGAIWWQVEQWWPKMDASVMLDFVEDIRDGKFDDWDACVRKSDHVTITPV